jgi:hypothetical protein
LTTYVRGASMGLATIVLLLGLVALHGEASAVTPMTCTPYGGAPSSSGSAGVVTYYYSHRCNIAPANVHMTEILTLTGEPTCEDSFPPSYSYSQARVDLSERHDIQGCHGYYTPSMTLILEGQFIYGSVPGCGRTGPDVVVCNWSGKTKYY